MIGKRYWKSFSIMWVVFLLLAFKVSSDPMLVYAVSDAIEPTEVESVLVENNGIEAVEAEDESSGVLDESGDGQLSDAGESEPEQSEEFAEKKEPGEIGESAEDSMEVTEEEQVLSSGATEQENTGKEEGTVGNAFVEVNPELIDREYVDSIGRSGGILSEGILFSAESVIYHIRLFDVTTDSAVLKYRLGEVEETVPIEERTVQIAVPADTNALLQMWYMDGEIESLFFQEYLVIEQEQPEIAYKRIRGEDGRQYIRVTAEDMGEFFSGIKEWQCVIDGENYIPEKTIDTKTYAFWGERNVTLKQEIDILLEGEESHEIRIAVSDNAGNTVSETFSMKALPEDVVSVTLPTFFYIAIRPYETGENTQIYSDDVVICNTSAFPVDVVVTSALVKINHTIPGATSMPETMDDNGEAVETLNLPEEVIESQKNCNINLKLRQRGEEPLLLPLPEGTSENVISFSLAAGQEDTNLQELMAQRYVDAVEGGDYALLNVCGNLNKGSEDMWRGGDLVVQLIFEFHRQEEIQE